MNVHEMVMRMTAEDMEEMMVELLDNMTRDSQISVLYDNLDPDVWNELVARWEDRIEDETEEEGDDKESA